MTPLLQTNFENWYYVLYRQAHGDRGQYELLKLAGNHRISPSTIVSDKFNNWVLSHYNEIFISFIVPNEPEEYFIASDSYIPHRFFDDLMDGIRSPLIPLHPKLLFRVFFQDVEHQTKEHLQLRFFFEPATVFNREALKYGTELLGTSAPYAFLS